MNDLHSIRARSALLKEFLNDSAEDDDSSRLPASSRPRSRRRERSLSPSLSVEVRDAFIHKRAQICTGGETLNS